MAFRFAPCPVLNRASGFTIVELIVVIALLGILSAVAISQFGNTQTYHDLQLKDQLISVARVAQQTALNRHDQTVTLEVSRPSGWLFEVKAQGLSLKQQRVESSAAKLFDPDGAEINSSTPYIVSYDNLGNLASGAVANLGFDASGAIVCISLAGYPYQAVDANDCASH
ncbi:MAG: type II secretion system protein [Halopseudomonas sp.]